MKNDFDDNIVRNIQKPLALLLVSGIMIATAVISHYRSTPSPLPEQPPQEPILQQPEEKPQIQPQPPKEPEIKETLPLETTGPALAPMEQKKPQKKSPVGDTDETFIF